MATAVSPTDRIQRCWAHLLWEVEYLAERYCEAGVHWRHCEAWTGWSYESVEVRRFAAKMRKGVDHWLTFLVVSGVELTNNRAEMALRERVVQRRIMGCFRNSKCTRIYETVMTLLATWKQRDLDLSQTMGETPTQEWAKS